jgi:cell division transport system permease protein
MNTIIYFIKETFRGFFQAKLMTFVSIITIAITLFSLGGITVVFMNIRLWLNEVSSKPGLNAYLLDAVYEDSATCEEKRTAILSFTEVDSVNLIRKEQALSDFKQDYGEDMFEAVDENPLPASFQITLKKDFVDANHIQLVKGKLKELGGFESIQYSQEWVAKLERFRDNFRWIAGIIVAILFLALHYMISNTVKLTIYARRDLIINMHFVGATNLYIKMPFILEGILQGMIGGLLSITSLWVLQEFFNFSLYWGEWYFLPVIFSVGVIFGWIGSLDAVRKFLV